MNIIDIKQLFWRSDGYKKQWLEGFQDHKGLLMCHTFGMKFISISSCVYSANCSQRACKMTHLRYGMTFSSLVHTVTNFLCRALDVPRMGINRQSPSSCTIHCKLLAPLSECIICCIYAHNMAVDPAFALVPPPTRRSFLFCWTHKRTSACQGDG